MGPTAWRAPRPTGSARRLSRRQGFHVVLIRYFDRTGDARAKWSTVHQDAPSGSGRSAMPSPTCPHSRTLTASVSPSSAFPRRVAGAPRPAEDAHQGRDRRVRTGAGGAEGAARMPPVLILHGARDRLVPVDMPIASKSCSRRGRAARGEDLPRPGARLLGAAQIDAAGRILAFLQRHLGGGF